MAEAIKNRYDFVGLFDVAYGNPNGDPDADNMPRMDQETGHGLVTDVCLKRKIRNYIEAAKRDAAGYRIYVKENEPLETKNNEALNYLGLDEAGIKASKKSGENVDKKVRDFMCQNFYDVRTFGAVLTTFSKLALNCGQVRGPVQLGFAHSIDPIVPQEVTITRVAYSTEKEAAEKKGHPMGRKYVVPYALYRVEGYISASDAEKCGFSEDDLALLWTALSNMFETDRSASRGNMTMRKLIAFKHDSPLGNAHADELFGRIKVSRKDSSKPAREYKDYAVDVDDKDIPKGVEIIHLL